MFCYIFLLRICFIFAFNIADIFQAVRDENIEKIQSLIDQHVENNSGINIITEDKLSLLTLAATSGNFEIFKIIYDFVKAEEFLDINYTLNNACELGHIKIIQFLFKSFKKK